MLRMWDARDVGCLGYRIFEILDERCGMFVRMFKFIQHIDIFLLIPENFYHIKFNFLLI